MLYNLLSSKLSDNVILVIASTIGFVLTYMLLMKPAEFLPRDGGKYVIDAEGRRVAVNEASNGKVTGVGFLFVLVFLGIVLLFIPISKEMIIYVILSAFMMLTGFLDDASRSPWGELIKGILDLILAFLAAISFIIFNGSDVSFLGLNFHIPVVLYAILAVALIWGSINVTNCSDGVDGLCGTVSVIELIGISVIFRNSLGKYSGFGMILSFILVAYLAYNWFPSTALMGDAGSRTIGFIIALLCMKTGHPFGFILFSMVFLFDGGLGLLKLAIMRVTKKPFLEKIRFPFHDELRKNRGWKIPAIVVFFAICELIFVIIEGVIIKSL